MLRLKRHYREGRGKEEDTDSKIVYKLQVISNDIKSKMNTAIDDLLFTSYNDEYEFDGKDRISLANALGSFCEESEILEAFCKGYLNNH